MGPVDGTQSILFLFGWTDSIHLVSDLQRAILDARAGADNSDELGHTSGFDTAASFFSGASTPLASSFASDSLPLLLTPLLLPEGRDPELGGRLDTWGLYLGFGIPGYTGTYAG